MTNEQRETDTGLHLRTTFSVDFCCENQRKAVLDESKAHEVLIWPQTQIFSLPDYKKSVSLYFDCCLHYLNYIRCNNSPLFAHSTDTETAFEWSQEEPPVESPTGCGAAYQWQITSPSTRPEPRPCPTVWSGFEGRSLIVRRPLRSQLSAV